MRCRALAMLSVFGFAWIAFAQAGGEVLVYRAEAREAGPAVTKESVKATIEVLARRFEHLGAAKGAPTMVAKDDRVEIHLSPDGADERAAYLRLVERRGDIVFRVRAEESFEQEHRERRLEGSTVVPSGFAWCDDEHGTLPVLVETPERPLAAKVDALAKSAPDSEELVRAREEHDKTLAASVFTNSQIAAASVQRTISRHGAQTLLHRAVRFEFKEDRRAAFEKFTGDHVNRVLCVVVDGKVHVSPSIKSALPGSGELRTPGTGYTEDEVREMAALFACGPLPLRLVPVKER